MQRQPPQAPRFRRCPLSFVLWSQGWRLLLEVTDEQGTSTLPLSSSSFATLRHQCPVRSLAGPPRGAWWPSSGGTRNWAQPSAQPGGTLPWTSAQQPEQSTANEQLHTEVLEARHAGPGVTGSCPCGQGGQGVTGSCSARRSWGRVLHLLPSGSAARGWQRGHSGRVSIPTRRVSGASGTPPSMTSPSLLASANTLFPHKAIFTGSGGHEFGGIIIQPSTPGQGTPGGRAREGPPTQQVYQRHRPRGAGYTTQTKTAQVF